MFILNRNSKELLTPRFAVVLGVVFLLSLFFAIVFSVPTNAKMTTDTAPSERAKSYSYWKATSKCVQDHMRPTIRTLAGNDGQTSPSQAGVFGGDGTANGEWFDDRDASVSVYPDGKLDCAQVMKKAMDLWGWTDGKQFLQDMGYKFNSDIPRWERNNDSTDKRFEAYKQAVLTKVGNVTDLLDGAAKYQLYLGTFVSGQTALSACSGKQGVALAQADATISDAARNNKVRDGVTYTVIKVAEGGTVNDYVYTYKKNATATDSTSGSSLTNFGSTWNYRNSINNPGAPGERFSCSELVSMINSNAPAFRAWGAANPETPDPVAGGGQSCTGTECEDAEAGSSCVVEGIGWAVCPIMNFLAGITDGAYGVISYFLMVDVKLIDTNSGTYSAWVAFRNIANVAFVIVFLFIIFSQLTGRGVSNYGIKKTLPRLVIAAILVNVSYFICQLAVDLSQILGVSIQQILRSIPIGTGTTTVFQFSDFVTDILAGSVILIGAIAATIAVAVIVALSITAPVLLAALFAVLMTVVILIGRQAAIVILIILAPLAFVAFMLPNTESWFKKWYKMFFALLMVFPIVALLFGGGELASRIIATVANTSSAEDPTRFFLNITAMGVAVIPLVMAPALLTAAMKATGAIGATISGMANKTNRSIKGNALASSKFGEAKQGLKNRFALKRAERRRNSPISNAVDNSRFGKAIGLDKGAARALSAVDNEEDNEVKAVMSQISHATSSTNRIDESARILKEAIINGDTTRARAAQRTLISSGNAGIYKLQQVYEGTDTAGEKGTESYIASQALASEALSAMGRTDREDTMGYLRSEVNSSGLKSKNNILARWGYEGKVKPNEISRLINPSNDPNDTLAKDTFKSLNSVELAGQNIKNLTAAKSLITPQAAQAILANQEASAVLDVAKRELFTKITVEGGLAVPSVSGGAAAAAESVTVTGEAAANTNTKIEVDGTTITVPPVPPMPAASTSGSRASQSVPTTATIAPETVTVTPAPASAPTVQNSNSGPTAATLANETITTTNSPQVRVNPAVKEAGANLTATADGETLRIRHEPDSITNTPDQTRPQSPPRTQPEIRNNPRTVKPSGDADTPPNPTGPRP